MTVAVMVDGVVAVAADGTRSWAPRPEEELAALRELVASAVGLDEARGDVLTLKSLEFQELPAPDTDIVSAGLLPEVASLDVMTLIQTAVLALVALVLGLFVIRPILTSASRPALSPPEPALALPPAASYGSPVLDGEVDSGFVYDGYGSSTGQEAAADDDPATRLRRLIEKRQAELIEILRGWMEQEEERA